MDKRTSVWAVIDTLAMVCFSYLFVRALTDSDVVGAVLFAAVIALTGLRWALRVVLRVRLRRMTRR